MLSNEIKRLKMNKLTNNQKKKKKKKKKSAQKVNSL